jgi:hypothetical protein
MGNYFSSVENLDQPEVSEVRRKISDADLDMAKNGLLEWLDPLLTIQTRDASIVEQAKTLKKNGDILCASCRVLQHNAADKATMKKLESIWESQFIALTESCVQLATTLMQYRDDCEVIHQVADENEKKDVSREKGVSLQEKHEVTMKLLEELFALVDRDESTTEQMKSLRKRNLHLRCSFQITESVYIPPFLAACISVEQKKNSKKYQELANKFAEILLSGANKVAQITPTQPPQAAQSSSPDSQLQPLRPREA